MWTPSDHPAGKEDSMYCKLGTLYRGGEFSKTLFIRIKRLHTINAHQRKSCSIDISMKIFIACGGSLLNGEKQ